MTVVISPKIKKTKVRIDMHGNEIDPESKRIIKPVEQPHIPSADVVAPKSVETQSSGGLNNLITKKLEEKIGDAIGSALEKMDLGDLISKAIDKALNK